MITSRTRGRLTNFVGVTKKRFVNIRGVIDLASIMVGVLIVSIVSAVLLATVFVLIPWAQDEAAQNDLRTASRAEAVLRTTDATLSYDSHPDSEQKEFEVEAITRPTQRMIVDAEINSWIAGIVSETSNIFLLASTGPETFKAINDGDGSFSLPADFVLQLPDAFTSERAQTMLDALASGAVYGAASDDGSPDEYGGSFEDGYATYTILANRENQVSLTRYTGRDSDSADIPNSVSHWGTTYTVTRIGDEAFYGNSLTSVTIGNSVTRIGNEAFAVNSLTSVTIGNSVSDIGIAAFYGNSLTSVTIPDSVTSIGESAFAENFLTSVTIPDSVTSISNGAFYNNELTSVTIGDSVTSINELAFAYNDLESVTIPSSVTYVADNAFEGNPMTAQ
jgi:type II secretory pathway pseudopilin PulG